MQTKSCPKKFCYFLDFTEDDDVLQAVVSLAALLSKDPGYKGCDELQLYLYQQNMCEVVKKTLVSSVLSSVDYLEGYLADVLQRATNDVLKKERTKKWLHTITNTLTKINAYRRELVGIHNALGICHEAQISIDNGLRINLISYSEHKTHRAKNVFLGIAYGRLDSK